jgi:hypothetical protein
MTTYKMYKIVPRSKLDVKLTHSDHSYINGVEYTKVFVWMGMDKKNANIMLAHFQAGNNDPAARYILEVEQGE